MDFDFLAALVFTAIFVTLKLCSVIAWSWFLILSPIWILFLAYFIHGVIEGAKDEIRKRKK